MKSTPNLRLAAPARRRLLAALAGGAVALPSLLRSSGAFAEQSVAEARSKHFPFGPVVPSRAMPALPVVTHDGRPTTLPTLFAGKVSAVQLMFTGCSATCPIQGALFAQTQRQLGDAVANAQFVSISIDPLADTPTALAAWLTRFGAAPGWLALQPRLDDLEALFKVLGEGGEPRPVGRDPHTGQVYLVDRNGDLVYRTPSLPPVAQIVEAMQMVAALNQCSDAAGC